VRAADTYTPGIDDCSWRGPGVCGGHSRCLSARARGAFLLKSHGVELGVGESRSLVCGELVTRLGACDHALEQSSRDLATQRVLDQLVAASSQLTCHGVELYLRSDSRHDRDPFRGQCERSYATVVACSAHLEMMCAPATFGANVIAPVGPPVDVECTWLRPERHLDILAVCRVEAWA
jgi:hypothetical protein